MCSVYRNEVFYQYSNEPPRLGGVGLSGLQKKNKHANIGYELTELSAFSINQFLRLIFRQPCSPYIEE